MAFPLYICTIIANLGSFVQLTPGKRGKGRKIRGSEDIEEKSPEKRRVSMSWAQRLKRVFKTDVEICDQRGGAVKVTVPVYPAPSVLVHSCTSSPVHDWMDAGGTRY